MSCQRTAVTELDDDILHSNAVVQQFRVPSSGNIVGFFNTACDSPVLESDTKYSTGGPCDSILTPTQLGGCLIVTTTAVYLCRQRLSPESLFLDYALSSKMNERAEDFGVTFRLDVCGLYKVAAEQKLAEKKYTQALRLFELSRCSTSHIIESFSQEERIPELVQYLHQVVYDDTGHAPLVNPKQVQDVLVKCFIHEVRFVVYGYMPECF